MSGLLTPAKWSCYLHITILFSLWAHGCCAAGGTDSHSFEMKLIYKYSDEFQEYKKVKEGTEHIVSDWPWHSTVEFHRELAHHDRHRHASRNLLTADIYSLTPSNTTYYSRTMGGLHYSFIELGTPSQRFLVALDTGSDLLWVPCDCKQCSAADWGKYDTNLQSLKFAIYSPGNSTTSKAVPCTDAACTSTLDPSVCNANAPQSCTYTARYLSANTSSTGPIVKDVVYLTSETTGKKSQSEIYLGCGELQTGDFLDGGAPNGLFGLGPEVYSVPSTFARNGITKNVFSLCFSSTNSSGTLIFGRQPGASLPSTPIIPVDPSAFYVLGVEGFIAAGKRISATFQAVFDTGTSYTIFPSNVVKPVGDALTAAVSLESFAVEIDTLTFDYCWNVTTDAQLDILGSLSIVFGGGEEWAISTPLVGFGDNAGNLLYVCLGILSSDAASTTPIIGFNFMRDYEYFFDQETAAFSWSPSNCTGTNGTNVLAPSISPALAPTAPAPAPEESAPAPKSSQRSPPPPASIIQAPPPPQVTSLNKASSISFQPMLLVLLFSSTFFLLLFK